MSDRHHRLGVGHLTALDVAPPDLVTQAARAGFDSVGVRLATANGQERRWPVDVGSPMLLDTVRRLGETGVDVLDIEILSLGPDTRVADYDHVLDTGVRLGARFLNVMCDDPELDRAADTFAALVERARLYEIRPAVEAMSYKQVSSLEQARHIAERSDGGVRCAGVGSARSRRIRCGRCLRIQPERWMPAFPASLCRYRTKYRERRPRPSRRNRGHSRSPRVPPRSRPRHLWIRRDAMDPLGRQMVNSEEFRSMTRQLLDVVLRWAPGRRS